MKFTYTHTKYTCYLAYTTSALINNFPPLLFAAFTRDYGLTLGQLGAMLVINFITQMLLDFLGARFIDKIGYRVSIVTANILAALGFLMMAFLPSVTGAPYASLCVSTVIYAVGSGIIEVLVSPIVEALPLDGKSSQMSLLHSFYCWGSVLVILLSTIFFKIFGLKNRVVLTCLWAILPIVSAILFSVVPIKPLVEDEADKVGLRKLAAMPNFILYMVLMTSAGAAELAVAQWASLFAESGLGVSKAVGDLLGPCMFAVFMGVSRVLYACFHKKWRLGDFIAVCAGGCVLSYMIITLSPNPLVSLAGCALCGFFVGIMWPGVLSLASANIPGGGTALFGILAFAGDIGCTLGPEVVALTSGFGIFESPLRTGILCAAVFPLITLAAISILKFKKAV